MVMAVGMLVIMMLVMLIASCDPYRILAALPPFWALRS